MNFDSIVEWCSTKKAWAEEMSGQVARLLEADHLERIKMEISLKDIESNASREKENLIDEYANFALLINSFERIIVETTRLGKIQYICILLKRAINNCLEDNSCKRRQQRKTILEATDYIKDELVRLERERKAKDLMVQDLKSKVHALRGAALLLEKEFIERQAILGLKKMKAKQSWRKMEKLTEAKISPPKVFTKSTFQEVVAAAELNAKQTDAFSQAMEAEYDRVNFNFENYLSLKREIYFFDSQINALVCDIQFNEVVLSTESEILGDLTYQEESQLAKAKEKKSVHDLELTMAKDYLKYISNEQQSAEEMLKQIFYETQQCNKNQKLAEMKYETVSGEYDLWKSANKDQSDDSDDDLNELDEAIEEVKTQISSLKERKRN